MARRRVKVRCMFHRDAMLMLTDLRDFFARRLFWFHVSL